MYAIEIEGAASPANIFETKEQADTMLSRIKAAKILQGRTLTVAPFTPDRSGYVVLALDEMIIRAENTCQTVC